MDFYNIEAKQFGGRAKQDYTIEPEFSYLTKDLICKGGVMYGFWHDGRWRNSIEELITIVDAEVREFATEFKKTHVDANVTVKLFARHSSNVMDKFLKYTKNRPQSEIEFNTRILFSEDVPEREDYSTTQLSYTPKPGPTPAFDEMFGLLYDQEELDKIMWFIGAVLTNNMHRIEKFLFLYGGKGTGKGTVTKLIKSLFEGYHDDIDLHKLTSDDAFATAGIKEVMVLVDDDTDLYNIKKDTNLLKLTSHEPLIINNKYQSQYAVSFKGLLIAASNQPFKVRNIDSGITRRAVVAKPTSNKHKNSRYTVLMEQIKFEYAHIAWKCMELFNDMGRGYYEDYMPMEMIAETDHFYEFVKESYPILGDPCTLKSASEMYKVFLEDMGWDSNGYKKKVKTGLGRYYREFHEQKRIDGVSAKNVYEGFKMEMFIQNNGSKQTDDHTLALKEIQSGFDEIAATYPAQYAKPDGTPKMKWDDVKTTLADINTEELHYVRVPENHIIVDFDLKNSQGEKDLQLNIEASKNFPETYAEVSKSGNGLHLHYIYDGDVGKLSPIYSEDIEIKVYRGNASLRRQLSLCTDKPIRRISSGLPEKEETVTMYKDIEIIQWNENKMRTAIKGNLERKYHDSTRPSIDFIVKIFDDAVKSGAMFDLKDMRQDILAFAASSSNQSKYCINAVSKIKYSTMEQEDATEIQRSAAKKYYEKDELYFYDIEVFPNLFIVCFKQYGVDKVTTWINPTREQIASMVELPLVGFNNRRYDNHIIYAALLGEDNLSLYRQSQRIINDKNAGSGMYSGAYELSYTDIYDYLNAGNKMSLKKWEVKLGIKHDEFELPWDQPVPEDMWERAAEYCGNDVDATEAVFDATFSDYTARRILSEISGLSMNATSNQHTAAIIFEGKPRREIMSELKYTDLSEMFPGYKYAFGKSEYRGEDPGEGGYVYAEPGVYENVVLLDIASMHPTSAIEMNMFGKYTKNYADLKAIRMDVKHKDYETARTRFDGRLAPYLSNEKLAKELSEALKTPINSVYGLSSASFETHFRHPDNNDNIVAKRGALFMIDLKHAVQEKGYTVAHIKTDSIKIPNADEEIIEFVSKFGRAYGYTFEHEATYSKLALVNKSTYICQDMDGQWHATGTQFLDPYVFKTLFSKEQLTKEDFFVTKEVKNASVYLGDKFIGRLAEVYASPSGEELLRITEDKNGAIAGTKGYRWKLSSDFTDRKDVDMIYYNDMVAKAIEAIKKVGDISIVIPDLMVVAEHIDISENVDSIVGPPSMTKKVGELDWTEQPFDEDELPF